MCLGRGDELLDAADLSPQRRHAVELLPAIDAMCRRHRLTPRDIGQVYVSVGPGSFTGLRIAVTTAKMLAMAAGCRIVAVPTLDVVVQSVPADRPHVAVMLNAKRGQCFTGLYDRHGQQWRLMDGPRLMTPQQVVEQAARPLTVVADHPQAYDWPADIERLDPALARPRCQTVRRIGRTLAAQNAFTDPLALTPLYVRLPEAEEIWQMKQT